MKSTGLLSESSAPSIRETGAGKGASELWCYIQTPTKGLHFNDEETKAQKHKVTELTKVSKSVTTVSPTWIQVPDSLSLVECLNLKTKWRAWSQVCVPWDFGHSPGEAGRMLEVWSTGQIPGCPEKPYLLEPSARSNCISKVVPHKDENDSELDKIHKKSNYSWRNIITKCKDKLPN